MQPSTVPAENYEEPDSLPSRNKQHTIALLTEAIKEGSFYLVYQPQCELTTGEIIGAEALLRCSHPQLQDIQIQDLISIAESTGLIHELGAFVLCEVAKQQYRWLRSGYAPIKVSINVSVVQLSSPGFIPMTIDTLAATGVSPWDIQLEVTESESIIQNQVCVDTLKALSDYGFSIAIDDFGTGHSGLMNLRVLNANTLKLDKFFVKDILDSIKDQHIVMTVAYLCHAFNLNSIAEGIETKEQAELLAGLGCRFGQGFYFGKPMASHELAGRFLQSALSTA